MSWDDLAWAAGLFEGEGCFTCDRSQGADGHVTVRASLAMTDEQVVRRFARVIGFGNVNERARRGELKTIWEWSTCGDRHIALLFELIGRWLSDRRLARLEELQAERRQYLERRSYGRNRRPIWALVASTGGKS
jgi:hypothetical protein